jgi:hypothetical protein
MNTARRHHYVQARYLEGFLAPPNEKLWCYGRRRQRPFEKIPDDLAHQRDFYRLPNAPPDQNLEQFLEKKVEGPGLDALRKLVATRRALDVERRIHLARYVAFQEMRVPHTRELNREQISQSVNHMMQRFGNTGGTSAHVQHVALVEGVEAKRGEPFTVSRQEIEAYAQEIAENPESFDLDSMVDLANDTTQFYATMRWTILIAKPTTAFITSDCPVFRTFSEPGGDDALLRPDCRVCCPLSSRALLVMDHDQEYLAISMKETAEGAGKTLPPTIFRTITDTGVKNFNRRIVEHSHLWCFSGRNEDWIKETMQQPSKRTKPNVFAKGNFSGVRWQRREEP